MTPGMMLFFEMFITRTLRNHRHDLGAANRSQRHRLVKQVAYHSLARKMSRREPSGCTPVYKFSFSSQGGRVSTGIAVADEIANVGHCSKGLRVIAV
jgi:hypothetical protein